jgi:hypothetical protein
MTTHKEPKACKPKSLAEAVEEFSPKDKSKIWQVERYCFRAGWEQGVKNDPRVLALARDLERLLVNEHLLFLDAKIRAKFLKEVEQTLAQWKGEK